MSFRSLERTATKERIAAARLRKEAKGEGWGRPRKTGPGDRERALAMRAQGKPIAEVARAFRVSVPTMNRLLRAPA